ncbi:hypothetical protein BG011_009292 [Mortierella polycephala]|uniref:Uncharacterized protein n=1 Tax=Mortierella polycephala TaxID=41804 RepID=A0A9P6QC88_9FUNG|nr:hypothetical protein BG011_009292 [Mortierella polycephala]
MNCRSIPRLEPPRGKTSTIIPTTVSAPAPNVLFPSFKTNHSSVTKPSLSTAPGSHSNMERQQYQRQNLEIVRHYKLKSVQVRETEDRLSRLEKENLGLRHDLNNAMKKLLSQNKDTVPVLASSSSPLLSVDAVVRDGSTGSSEENNFRDVHSHRHDSLKRKRRSDSKIRNSKADAQRGVPHREEGFDESSSDNPAVDDERPQTKRQRGHLDFQMPISGSFLVAKLDETEVIYQRQHESLCAMMESFKSTSQLYRDLLRKLVKITVPEYQDVDQESITKSDKHQHRLRPSLSPSLSPLPTLSTPQMPRNSAHEKRSLYSRSPRCVEHSPPRSPSPSPFFLSGRRLWEKRNRRAVRDGGNKIELSQSPKLQYKNYRMPVAKVPRIHSQTISSSWSAESSRGKPLAAADEESTADTSVPETTLLPTQRAVRPASRIHHRISALPRIAEHSSHAKSIQSSPQVEPASSLHSAHDQATAWKVIPTGPVRNATPAARLERPQSFIVRNLKRGPGSQAPQAQERLSASHNRRKNMPVADSTVPSFVEQSPDSNGWDMAVVRFDSSADPSPSNSNEATTLNSADDATNDRPNEGLDNGLDDGTNGRTNCGNSCDRGQEETIGVGRTPMKRSTDTLMSKASSNGGNGARNKRRLIRMTRNKLRASPSPMIKSRACISIAQLKKMTPKQLLHCMNKSLLGTVRAPVLTKAIIQNATVPSTRLLTLGSNLLSSFGDAVSPTVSESMPSPPTPPSGLAATKQSGARGQQEEEQLVAVMIPCVQSQEIGTERGPNPTATGDANDIESALSGANDDYDTRDTGSQGFEQSGQYQDMLQQHEVAPRSSLKRTTRKLVPGEPGTYSLLTPRRPALRNKQQVNHKKKHAEQQSRGSLSTDNHDSEPSNH